jgi:hypothetical protein
MGPPERTGPPCIGCGATVNDYLLSFLCQAVRKRAGSLFSADKGPTRIERTPARADLGGGHHPRATSRVIITANPTRVARVARSVFFCNWDWGISSSTTTKIMAPAAKARA